MQVGSLFRPKIARWNSTTLRIIGLVMMIIAFFMIVPLTYAFFNGESLKPYVFPMPIIFALGLVLFLLFEKSENFRNVHGLILIALTWLTMFTIGAIPYIVAGMGVTDAFFESVSGMTTTGSTIIADVNVWPVSLMIWRSLTQWLGGIAIIIIFMYVLPLLGMGRMFFTNELEGSGSSNLSMKMGNAAKAFVMVYVFLSALNLVLLLLCGIAVKDALCLSFTTISTGGLLSTNDSLASFSFPVQMITMAFMFVGGVNFYLHYKALYKRDIKAYTSNNEFKLLCCWLAAGALFLFSMNMILDFLNGVFDAGYTFDYLKNSFFTVISFATTTGYTTFDIDQSLVWGTAVLLTFALIGSSAGSTSGGIKFGRIRVVIRFFQNSIKSTMHPNAVYDIKVDGESIDRSRVLSAVSITLLYLITILFATMVLLAQGINWGDSMYMAAASVSNLGMFFPVTGTLSSTFVEIFLMLLMWLGRLEIMIAIVFFTPSFWQEVMRTHRGSMRERKNHKPLQ